MPYVDGFVIPLRKKDLKTYRRLATLGGRVWRDHGALEYRECVADDLTPVMGDRKGPPSFPRMARLRRSETLVFAWIVFRSRADRDRINARVLRDPRIASMDPSSMPFDMKRMAYGGFRTIVDHAPGSRPRRRRSRTRARRSR
jgi:uncharacterized protein YbaA (DUF1428 family)